MADGSGPKSPRSPPVLPRCELFRRPEDSPKRDGGGAISLSELEPVLPPPLQQPLPGRPIASSRGGGDALVIPINSQRVPTGVAPVISSAHAEPTLPQDSLAVGVQVVGC